MEHSDYEAKLKEFLTRSKTDAEHLVFNQSCHSVADAAKAAKAEEDDFVKNVCMINGAGELVVAIVKGDDRASTTRVGQALGEQPLRAARPDEILLLSGFPCGGTPSFGYTARFLVDPRVVEKEAVYTGGGSERSLVRIRTAELMRLNNAEVVRIRK